MALILSPGRWQIVPAHTNVHFKVRHFGLTNVRGRFTGVDAWLDVADSLAHTRFGAAIDMTTVDTNQADRDDRLRSLDFFSADTQPAMTFQSTHITDLGLDHYEAIGELTIGDVTKPIFLNVEFTGAIDPGDGQEHAGFVAATQIRRDDFGIDFNMPLGVDKFTLGKRVNVEIDAQFVPARL